MSVVLFGCCVVRVTCKYLGTPQRKPAITEGSQIEAANYGKTWTYTLAEGRVAAVEVDAAVRPPGGQRADHLCPAAGEAMGLCDRNAIVVILIGTNDALVSVTRATLRANVDALSQLGCRTSCSRACCRFLPKRYSAFSTTRTSWSATSALTCFHLCALIWRCPASTTE